jgi:hypothetical protein
MCSKTKECRILQKGNLVQLNVKVGILKCSGNTKECVLDTMRYLVGKVEKRARKPWITQEMITEMNERRKWKNVNAEEGRRN